ncbi:MAG: prefoldin subunit alpha [Candidatus Woesearchaeota archaeon]
MVKQEELQQKYMEFQMLDQQMKQTQKQLQALEDQVVEIIYTQQGLEELKKVKEGTEILVPVSSGIFAKAKIQKPGELIVNVGAGTAVSKTVDSTQEMLSKQLIEVQRMHQAIIEVVQKIESQMQGLEREITESGE